MFCIRQLIYCIFITIITVFLPANQSNAEQPILFGGVSNIPPLSYEENQVVKGFFPDLIREIAKRADIQVTIKLFPFKRLNAGLKKGSVDGVMSIFYKKNREEYLLYSASPVLISRTRIFVKKENIFEFNSINDLFGRKIGVLSGWSVANTDFENAKLAGQLIIQDVSRFDQNLKKLITGRVDCLIMTEQLTWYHAKNLGLSDKIIALKTPIASSHTFMAISKQSKTILDYQAMMQTLNTVHNDILADGTYKYLQDRHQITTLN